MNTPKFKEGDWIKSIHSGRTARVVMLLKTCYSLWFSNDDSYCLDYSYQDNWELTDAPPKTKLEEAAESFAWEKEQPLADGERLSYTFKPRIEAFKEGAEWQKSQDESRRIANIQLANTDTPVDTEMEVAFNDIWRDAEVIVERDGTLDEKATELMKAVCHDFFESGKEWQKERMGWQARKELGKTDITLAELVAFDEGLKLGRRLEKQDMLKDAVEGIARPDDCEIWVNFEDYGYKFNDGDKIKIIIVPIKEDKE